MSINKSIQFHKEKTDKGVYQFQYIYIYIIATLILIRIYLLSYIISNLNPDIKKLHIHECPSKVSTFFFLYFIALLMYTENCLSMAWRTFSMLTKIEASSLTLLSYLWRFDIQQV